jgi:transposase
MGITYASLPNRAKNISALLSSVGVEGIVPSLAAIGTIDAEVFEAYLEWLLLPKMPPESLMARDYLSAQKSERVEEPIEVRVGGVVVPLPPYSPAPNPIEEAFPEIEGLLRKAQARTEMPSWKR